MNSGRLVVVAGPPLAGKSTLAKELVLRLNAILLSMDELREVLFPHGRHSRSERDACYRTMHWLASKILQGGKSVVLDATYARPTQRRALELLRSGSGVPMTVIECKVAPDEAVRRFLHRSSLHPARDLTPERVRLLAARYRYTKKGLVLEMTDTVARLAERALREVEK